MTNLPNSRPLTAAETDILRTRQRERNKVMALILGFLVLLFFAVSIVKIAAKPPHQADGGAEQAEQS